MSHEPPPLSTPTLFSLPRLQSRPLSLTLTPTTQKHTRLKSENKEVEIWFEQRYYYVMDNWDYIGNRIVLATILVIGIFIICYGKFPCKSLFHKLK